MRETEITEIHRIIKVSGIPQWKIAEKVGISVPTLCIWVRPNEIGKRDREKRIKKALRELRKEFKTEDATL